MARPAQYLRLMMSVVITAVFWKFAGLVEDWLDDDGDCQPRTRIRCAARKGRRRNCARRLPDR